MELELRQDYISCWENGYHTTMNQEETSEMIVPDACPDILQILDGEGKLLLQRKDSLDGKAELSGVIKVTVLYQPEGDRKVCSMATMLPFSCTVESSAITPRSKLVVVPQIQKVDIHLLNPRKVLIKVNYTLDIQCYTAQSLPICPGVEEESTYAIQQKVDTYESHMVVAAMEKMFNYSDVLALPAGHPDMVELIRVRGDCTCNEAKVIGNKLVFKGDAKLNVLYRSMDDGLYSTAFNLPFSQIMECSEAGEDAVPEMKIIYTDMSCKLGDEEGRSIAVELELMAQSVLRKTERSPVLVDLYSTGYETEIIQKEHPSYIMMDQGIAPETVREVLEVGNPVREILDVQARPLQMARSKEGDAMALNADVEVFVLYATDDGGVDHLHRRLTATHPVPIAESWDYQSDFWISRDCTATPVGAGIEISFTVDFQWIAMEKGMLYGIEQVTLEEKAQIQGDRPSVIIRSVRAGESLWDIAKAYGTTEAEIIEVNSLTSTELYPGQMLIIPRVQEIMILE